MIYIHNYYYFVLIFIISEEYIDILYYDKTHTYIYIEYIYSYIFISYDILCSTYMFLFWSINSFLIFFQLNIIITSIILTFTITFIITNDAISNIVPILIFFNHQII